MEEDDKKRRLTITHSELNAFRTCRRRWWFRYEQGLRPKRKARALAVGSCVHEGVAEMYRVIKVLQGNYSTTNMARADQLANAAHTAMHRKLREYTAELVEAMKHATYPEDIEKLIEESEAMTREAESSVMRFVEAFGEEDARRYVVVAVEHPFEVVLRDARGLDLSRITSAGVKDLVLYDPEVKDYVLGEHKTTKGDAMNADLRLDLDPQTMGYVYALREQLRHGGFPDIGTIAEPRVGRVFYNVVRKGGPKPPKINKDGTVSVAKCETTRAIYEEALLAQPEPSWAKKNPQRWNDLRVKQRQFAESLPDETRYVARHEKFHTPRTIEEWRNETHADARVVRWTTHKRDPLPLTRNTNACNLPWQPRCAYRDICIDDSEERREMFDVADSRHTEVVEALEARTADEDSDPFDFGF